MSPPVRPTASALSRDAGANIKPAMAAKPLTGSASILPQFNASHMTIFLRNLRLLNLDQMQDWPSISAKTFSTKGALQNQKQRLQCVEWALYHLFEIWDTDETKIVCFRNLSAKNFQLQLTCLCNSEAWALLPTPSTITITQSSCRSLPQPFRA